MPTASQRGNAGARGPAAKVVGTCSGQEARHLDALEAECPTVRRVCACLAEAHTPEGSRTSSHPRDPAANRKRCLLSSPLQNPVLPQREVKVERGMHRGRLSPNDTRDQQTTCYRLDTELFDLHNY